MEVKSLDQPNNTWFFFPILGLNIKRSKTWRNFAFGDATIVNSEDLKDYLRTTNCNQSDNHLLNPKHLNSTFSNKLSYLIVNADKYLCDKTVKKIENDAIERAYQIASLLHFFFLYSSYYTNSVCLTSEIFSTEGFHYQYTSHRGRWGQKDKYTNDEHRITVPDNSFVYSIKGLKKQLQKLPFTNLSKIIIEKINNKHTKYILVSLLNFYKTSNSVSPTLQQIGSVTSIELLLRSNDSFNHLENRIKILLGEKIYSDFVDSENKDKINKPDYEGVIKKRHLVVHKAITCDNTDAYRAICLYCHVLISYCAIYKKFYSKAELNNYLDLIYKYKYNDLFKQDTLNLLDSYYKGFFDQDSIHWVYRQVIKSFGLCNPNNKEMLVNSLFEAVFYIHKIKNIGIQEAYKIVCKSIYYHKIPFENYNEFIIEYEKNIDHLITDFDLERIDGYII